MKQRAVTPQVAASTRDKKSILMMSNFPDSMLDAKELSGQKSPTFRQEFRQLNSLEDEKQIMNLETVQGEDKTPKGLTDLRKNE